MSVNRSIFKNVNTINLSDFFNETFPEIKSNPFRGYGDTNEPFFSPSGFLENEQKCLYRINLAGLDRSSLKVEVDPTTRKLYVQAVILHDNIDGTKEKVRDIKVSYIVPQKWDISKPSRTELVNGLLYVEFNLHTNSEKKCFEVKMD